MIKLNKRRKLLVLTLIYPSCLTYGIGVWAFSVPTLISSVTMPVGLVISSPIAEKVGVNVWFFISGISIVLVTAATIFCYEIK